MSPRHAATAKPDDDATPTSGAPTVSKKGITIPWGWIMSLTPTAGLVGALGHASLFGAPPEFSKRLDDHQTQLGDHERRLTELDKGAALDHAAQARMADDIKRILQILEGRR